MITYSDSLRDKRVDKILLNMGYEKCEIFYSPIQVWLVSWVLLLLTVPILFFYTLLNLPSFLASPKEILSVLAYGTTGYLVISLLNRSFAITDDEFLVIDSHFPFCGVKRFKFEEVVEIKISSDWKLWSLIIFGIMGNNYVEIKTKNQKKKFYCLFLEVDCHDENWTEKTLDTLEESLKSKGVHVKLKI